MSNKIPSMTDSRIDLVQVMEAHKEHEANAVMSAMMVFETKLSETIRDVSISLREKQDPAKRVALFDGILPICLRLGANDLVEATRTALSSHKSGMKNPSAAVADAVYWLTIAEQTRVANIAFFQACQLFGRALNGKRLPPLDP